MSEREYVLGTRDEEVERLGLQHTAWRAQAHAAWERAGFSPGHTVLDLGCGPGYATLDLARVVGPRGKVVAVDQSRRFLERLEAELEHLALTNVDVVERDVRELDLAPESLDGAWSRWVFSFAPETERIVASVARALKPGATFAIHEYVSYAGCRLAPPSTRLASVVAAIERSWRERGGEPDIALRLGPLLEKHHLEVRHLETIGRVARPVSLTWRWPGSFFESYLPVLEKSGHLSAEDRRVFEAEWRAAEETPGAFYVCPIVLEIVARKR